MMLEFFTSTHPKAKKEHQCDLCNGTICKGEKYHRYSGKYDGRMFDYKYHLACQNIINAYCDAMDDREYANEEIEEWLHDTYCHDCKHQEDVDCPAIETSCPYIRKHYAQEDKQ